MKRFIYLFILSLLAGLTACGGGSKKTDEGSLILMQDSVDSRGLQRMQVSKAEVDIKFKGKDYHSFISRTPDENLPLVKNEMGNTFVDNKIQLRLTRGNEQVFNMTFTKKNFSSIVSDDFLSKSILEGMVYNKTTPQGIVYAASVCYPQTDLYVPISITITADGKMTMEKEELLEEIYEELQEYYKKDTSFDKISVTFYEDTYSLYNLYRFAHYYEEAYGKYIWLKSGASLVIEHTEAMTVIDVNTGKYSGKKNLADTIRLINLEAAKEIAHQLRLRNLSGIIMVDFIDMDAQEDKTLLMDTLKAAVRPDPVKTTVIDMTPLNLVEMTRKKEKRPLWEQIAQVQKLNNQSLDAAKIVIAMIPVLAVYPFLQKYFVSGITLGSVKG